MSDTPDATAGSGQTALILRWIARIGGLVSVGLVAALFIRERIDPLQMPVGDLIVLRCLPALVAIGLLAGWRREFAGGALAVGGWIAFLGAHRFLFGTFPKGWVFTALAAPGFLLLFNGVLARLRTGKREAGKESTD